MILLNADGSSDAPQCIVHGRHGPRGRRRADGALGGTNGRDSLRGTGGDDLIRLAGGPDLGFGVAGSDTIFGGSGDDSIYGGIGDDVMRIGDGWGNCARYVHGSFFGDAGDDAITVGLYTYNVRVFGGSGDDVITAPGGEYGATDVFGGDGDDVLRGGFVRGGNGDDTIHAADGGYAYGEAGDDVIYGREETYRTYSGATIHGGAGDDLVLGGGPDSVRGGFGNDAIRGGDVWGDAGNDTFYFHGAHHGFHGSDDRFEDGFSVVHDFQAGESISLNGAQMITGYDASYQAILAPVTLDDLAFSRGGGTLFVSTPEHPDWSGEYGSRSIMTVSDFFERGLTSIKVDGVVVDLSDLASG